MIMFFLRPMLDDGTNCSMAGGGCAVSKNAYSRWPRKHSLLVVQTCSRLKKLLDSMPLSLSRVLMLCLGGAGFGPKTQPSSTTVIEVL